jgi:uncharacterized lipoprotein YddW (UPF0748 family)
MNRRKFLDYLIKGSMLSVASGCVLPETHLSLGLKMPDKGKHWLWLSPGNHHFKSDITKHLTRIKEAGFEAILVQAFNGRKTYYKSDFLPAYDHLLEKLIPIAKSCDLEIHAWIFSLMCNSDKIRKSHPEWFTLNRNLQSSLEQPPYVGYYRWLCPSRPEVTEYLGAIVNELSQLVDLDGIHLDYIRYPDVILPEALQPTYNLVQNSELPEFDSCYCPVCRTEFEKIYGIDPLNLSDPSDNLEWRRFREQNITRIVSEMATIVRKKKKTISAAVFPTPAIAKKLVRQNWSEWNVDAFFPMIYHNYYHQDLEWIKTATQEGVNVLSKGQKLYSGVYLPFLRSGDLEKAHKFARQAGADGVSLFEWDKIAEDSWGSF